MILAELSFSWEAFSIKGLSQDPWHIGVIGIGLILIVLLLLLWKLPKLKAARFNLDPKEQFNIENETRKTWATIAFVYVGHPEGNTGEEQLMIRLGGIDTLQ